MNRDEATQKLAELIEIYKSLRDNGKKLRDCLERNLELQAKYFGNINELTDVMNEYMVDIQHLADTVEDDND